MKELQFKEDSSQKIYADYMNQIKKSTSILSKEDQLEVLMEFNSHIHEAMNKNSNDLEETLVLTEVITKLGAVKEILKPIIADRKLNQATRTYNPKHIFQALLLNARNGVNFILFGFLYLALACFSFLILAKLIFPSKTGLFLLDDKFHSFGFISETTGTKEILGFWFFPLVLVLVITLYLLITLLFRITRKQNTNDLSKNTF